MGINYDGVFEVRLFYDTTISSRTITHRMTIDVRLTSIPDVGTDFAEILAQNWNGVDNDLAGEVDLFVDGLKPMFSAQTTFTHAELWMYPATGTNALWISNYAIGEAGTSGSAPTPAHQATITFRSTLGGIMRIQLMESVLVGSTVDTYPFSNTSAQTFANVIVSTSVPWQARDDARPIIPLRLSLGENEKLFRKRFRE